MNAPLHIRSLRIHRLAIPMRMRFEHAAAARDTSDPIVVELAGGAPYAHAAGYGETLARPYVTGETPESVVQDLTNQFAPHLTEFHAGTFANALEFIEALPFEVGGRVVTAARAALELALLDLTCRVFRRRPADVVGWMGLGGFGAPGCLATARYSGMVIGRTAGRVKAFVRLQRLYGLRDFKLKAAIEGWEQRLQWAADVLGKSLADKKVTLRVDANGRWSLAEANEALPILERCRVCALEQPLPDADDGDLPYLAEQTSCDLIADESLLTISDAQRLLEGGGVHVLNIRLAKNGGLMPALRMARLALAAGRQVQLGCLVGETSILSAAGLAFLEACPRVRFVEGAFARFLLRADVARRPIRFAFGGRARARPGVGWAIDVDTEALSRLATAPPRTLQF